MQQEIALAKHIALTAFTVNRLNLPEELFRNVLIESIWRILHLHRFQYKDLKQDAS